MASGGVEGDSDEFTECSWCGISTGGEEHGGIDLGSSFVKFSGRGKVSIEMPRDAVTRDIIFIHQQTAPSKM